MNFIRKLGSVLLPFWPPYAIRIMRLGENRVVEFRSTHGREPTEAEWSAISNSVARQVLGSK